MVFFFLILLLWTFFSLPLFSEFWLWSVLMWITLVLFFSRFTQLLESVGYVFAQIQSFQLLFLRVLSASLSSSSLGGDSNDMIIRCFVIVPQVPETLHGLFQSIFVCFSDWVTSINISSSLLIPFSVSSILLLTHPLCLISIIVFFSSNYPFCSLYLPFIWWSFLYLCQDLQSCFI